MKEGLRPHFKETPNVSSALLFDTVDSVFKGPLHDVLNTQCIRCSKWQIVRVLVTEHDSRREIVPVEGAQYVAFARPSLAGKLGHSSGLAFAGEYSATDSLEDAALYTSQRQAFEALRQDIVNLIPDRLIGVNVVEGESTYEVQEI